MSFPANPVLNDAVQSYYAYIYNQFQTLNPHRLLRGLVDAQDWPQIQATEAGLYCIYLRSVAVDRASAANQIYFEHYLQWNWLVLGTDLLKTQVGPNRGDRHATSMAIIEELRQVHFPGFAPKQALAVDPVTGVVTLTPFAPVEMISWTVPKLGMTYKSDDAGMVYGAAPLMVYGYSTVNPVLNP